MTENLLLLKDLLETYNYNNAYHSTIKMKLIDVTSSAYIDLGTENNYKDLKIKVVDHITISKYKNIFAKLYGANLFEEVFAIKKVKILFRRHMLLEILEWFTKKKNWKRQIKQSLEFRSNQEKR